MPYTNWTCPTCSYSNGAYDSYCRACNGLPPEVRPYPPRVQVPGSSTSHPGMPAFQPLDELANKPMPGGPTDQWQYDKKDEPLVFEPVSSYSSEEIARSSAFGPLTQGTGFNEPLVSHRAVVKMGPFDLRADLEDSAGMSPKNVRPIWRGMAAGAGAQVCALITFRTLTPAPTTITMWQSEQGSPWNPDDMPFLSAPTPVSLTIFDGAQSPFNEASNINDTVGANGYTWSTTILISPPSNPIRYWRCNLAFDIMQRASYDDETEAWTVTNPNVPTDLQAQVRYTMQ